MPLSFDGGGLHVAVISVNNLSGMDERLPLRLARRGPAHSGSVAQW
jgi:hypothetical protein